MSLCTKVIYVVYLIFIYVFIHLFLWVSIQFIDVPQMYIGFGLRPVASLQETYSLHVT